MARRVLIADDHEDGRAALADLLIAVGFHVEKAANGDEALRIAASFRPEIAIIDLSMPGIDGFAVGRALGIPGDQRPFLIALTGFGGSEMERRAREAGFDYFALKPWNCDAMLTLLGVPEAARKRTSA